MASPSATAENLIRSCNAVRSAFSSHHMVNCRTSFSAHQNWRTQEGIDIKLLSINIVIYYKKLANWALEEQLLPSAHLLPPNHNPVSNPPGPSTLHKAYLPASSSTNRYILWHHPPHCILHTPSNWTLPHHRNSNHAHEFRPSNNHHRVVARFMKRNFDPEPLRTKKKQKKKT